MATSARRRGSPRSTVSESAVCSARPLRRYPPRNYACCSSNRRHAVRGWELGCSTSASGSPPDLATPGIMLWTQDVQLEARRLYQRAGFKLGTSPARVIVPHPTLLRVQNRTQKFGGPLHRPPPPGLKTYVKERGNESILH